MKQRYAALLAPYLRSVVLTIVRRQLVSCNPLQRPIGRPWFGVGAGIIDRNVVFQCIESRTRDSLDEMKITRMGKTAIRKPDFFVKVFRVDDQCVAFPMAKPTAVVRWEILVVRLQRSAIVVNHTPVVVAPSDQDEDALFLPVLEELNSIRELELPRSARRHAVEKHRIALQKTALAQFIQISCPSLKGSDLVNVSEIAQQAIGVHRNIRAGL